MNDETDDIDQDSLNQKINGRVLEIRERIESAAKRSGRTGKDVLLVGVTKYALPNDGIVEGLLNAGVFDFAENRPQRLLEKVEFWNKSDTWNQGESTSFLSPSRKDRTSMEEKALRWHFIGSLQRNKVRRVLPHIALLHSVDSWKLLETIERILAEEEVLASHSKNNVGFFHYPHSLSILLEVHISEDETKQGFSLAEIVDVIPKLSQLSHIVPCGLMGMAGLRSTSDEVRRQFTLLRETLERCQHLCPELTTFKELSMGMSGDFETAIEEGATIVRIGSVLYP